MVNSYDFKAITFNTETLMTYDSNQLQGDHYCRACKSHHLYRHIKAIQSPQKDIPVHGLFLIQIVSHWGRSREGLPFRIQTPVEMYVSRNNEVKHVLIPVPQKRLHDFQAFLCINSALPSMRPLWQLAMGNLCI
jgi:hypothetical protein